MNAPGTVVSDHGNAVFFGGDCHGAGHGPACSTVGYDAVRSRTLTP